MRLRPEVSPASLAGMLLVAVAWALFLVFTGSVEAILFTVPVFLLAGPLSFGFYPGEEAIAKLRGLSRRRATTEISVSVPIETRVLSGRVGSFLLPARGPPMSAF